GYFYVGYSSGAAGTYSLSKSAIFNVTGNENVGYLGDGTFNHAGGSHTVSGFAYIGGQPGSTGDYTLSAGIFSVDDTEVVGQASRGTMTQSGGIHTVGINMFVGEAAGSTGNVFHSGGVSTMGNNLMLGA